LSDTVTIDSSDGWLALKARGDEAADALRSLIDSGQLDGAPPLLRQEITKAAIRLATSVGAQDREGAIIAAEVVLDRARSWLSRRPPNETRRGFR
jgi:hypothetical protein